MLKPALEAMVRSMGPMSNDGGDAAVEAISAEMTMAMLRYMPLRGIVSFGGDGEMAKRCEALLAKLNRD